MPDVSSKPAQHSIEVLDRIVALAEEPYWETARVELWDRRAIIGTNLTRKPMADAVLSQYHTVRADDRSEMNRAVEELLQFGRPFCGMTADGARFTWEIA